MREPKYLLVFEEDKSGQRNDFVIYEQAEIGGQIGQRVLQKFLSFESAVRYLCRLNDNEPILLAYSAKPVDNKFEI